ncbi:uridine kinase family protein [Flexithrix dorotheae]|uniref:uridine kinase family protein n=1 Tax=Flexithrix dorotheae TaxID=70993 RepID=UPI0003A27099|nr:uridine kinase [Flexithrix dorotheae]
MMHPFLIGITGGSGSGKTYFLNKLLERVGKETVTLLSQDNYYRPMHLQKKDENGVENFDLPESIDDKWFAEDIAKLKAGKTIQLKEYTFNNPVVQPKTLVFKPSPVIIVEGIFVLHYPEVARQIDLKLFIEAKDMIKIKRRILRDNEERGYDLHDVLYRYEHHVMPAYEKYIGIHKRDADIVIYNDQKVNKALDVMETFIKSKLKNA